VLDTCLSSGRLYRGGFRNVVGGNVFPPYERTFRKSAAHPQGEGTIPWMADRFL
jgi:hypothetical protein